jgi:sulfide:quinone oxidoreductase
MQNIKKLNDRMTVGPQISIDDIARIRAAGFTAIICNRPDGEDEGQLPWREIEAAAKAAGLETRFVPQAGRELTKEALDGFAQAIAEIDGAIFAYCRTGTRSEKLWNATQSLTLAAE